MMSGFPLPCFDFEDEEDVMPTFTTIPARCSPQVLNDADIDALGNQGLSISVGNPIRCTGNSTVYKAYAVDSGQCWAVKITEHKKQVQAEFQKRKQLPDSPYLVETISLTESPTKAILQMELCERGDIQNMVFDEITIWTLIHDVSMAIHQIHKAGWMHLDISPGNILLTDDAFKLADFGTVMKDGEFQEGCEGAGPYVSPEALAFPNGPFAVSFPTDIFSFGVVLLEAASGKAAPRGGCSGYNRLRNGALVLGGPDYPCEMSQELINLVNTMMSFNPNNRPTAKALLKLSSGQ